MKEIEMMVVKKIFPGITQNLLGHVVDLLHSKQVPILDKNIESNVRKLTGSVIRHKHTEYDKMVKKTNKKNARFYCQPIIDNVFSHIEKEHCANQKEDVAFSGRVPASKVLYDMPDLLGNTYGEFTVIGRINGSWVVRCNCGVIENRKTRALLDLSIEHDRCVECLRKRGKY